MFIMSENSQPVEVIKLVDALENIIGKPARRELLPMRSVDVLETFADSSETSAGNRVCAVHADRAGLRVSYSGTGKYTQRPS